MLAGSYEWWLPYYRCSGNLKNGFKVMARGQFSQSCVVNCQSLSLSNLKKKMVTLIWCCRYINTCDITRILTSKDGLSEYCSSFPSTHLIPGWGEELAADLFMTVISYFHQCSIPLAIHAPQRTLPPFPSPPHTFQSVVFLQRQLLRVFRLCAWLLRGLRHLQLPQPLLRISGRGKRHHVRNTRTTYPVSRMVIAPFVR